MAWYRYFAYGSNMLTARLRERTPSAVLVGPAVLSNHALHFHHVSRKDGSAKCNILPGPGERESVHGVVFDIPAAEQPALDAAGSLYAEGLGISLFRSVESTDPTALVGLPLISLTTMLNYNGYTLP